ncbi:hypothetical protein GCM10010428_22830 [Actinosynnema pretiosum subsp. pretiosum]
MWASAALPAARTYYLIDMLTGHGRHHFADKAYQGADGAVRTPFKRHGTLPHLSPGQKAPNRAHARVRTLGECAASLLKGWKFLTKIRYCPRQATALIVALLVLPPHQASPLTTMKKAQCSRGPVRRAFDRARRRGGGSPTR